jgi:hypothetical protein
MQHIKNKEQLPQGSAHCCCPIGQGWKKGGSACAVCCRQVERRLVHAHRCVAQNSPPLSLSLSVSLFLSLSLSFSFSLCLSLSQTQTLGCQATKHKRLSARWGPVRCCALPQFRERVCKVRSISRRYKCLRRVICTYAACKEYEMSHTRTHTHTHTLACRTTKSPHCDPPSPQHKRKIALVRFGRTRAYALCLSLSLSLSKKTKIYM